LKLFRDGIGVFMPELVADTTKLHPFVAGWQPAKLFQSIKAIQRRLGGNFLSHGEQRSGHEPIPHVVLEGRVTVGKLIEQAPIVLTETIQIRRRKGR
jgi:hypothetical protein